jgi:hypothetical protein
MTSGFGSVIGIIKLWDHESDGRYHMIAQGTATVACTNAFGVSVCAPKIHAQTAVYPPAGSWHAELEVIGGYASQAPGLEILDDANSGGFCYFC